MLYKLRENLVYNMDRHSLFCDAEEHFLSRSENALLSCLTMNKNKLSNYETLANAIYGYGESGYDSSSERQSIRNFVRRLRKLGLNEDVLKSVPGRGYMLVISDDADMSAGPDKDAGDKSAMEKQYLTAMRELVNRNLEAYFSILNNLADEGYPQAISTLGVEFINGDNVKQNVSLGIKYYEKAADLDLSIAQLNLGDLYFYGMHVPQDMKKGVEYYRKAAENANDPDPDAMYRLYKAYIYGKGVEQDISEAEKWRKRAAAAGVTEFHNFLKTPSSGSASFLLKECGLDSVISLPWVLEAESDGGQMKKTVLYEDFEAGELVRLMLEQKEGHGPIYMVPRRSGGQKINEILIGAPWANERTAFIFRKYFDHVRFLEPEDRFAPFDGPDDPAKTIDLSVYPNGYIMLARIMPEEHEMLHGTTLVCFGSDPLRDREAAACYAEHAEELSFYLRGTGGHYFVLIGCLQDGSPDFCSISDITDRVWP